MAHAVLEMPLRVQINLQENGLRAVNGYRGRPTGLEAPKSGRTAGDGSLKTTVERVERDMITVDLEHTNGNVTAAAQQLGITPRMLRYKIKRLGINRPQTSGRRN